jgi:hypothetical protein
VTPDEVRFFAAQLIEDSRAGLRIMAMRRA